MVLTDEAGRVLRFVEKPDWRQVVTDTVNTGIYVIHPRIMRRVPSQGQYDFSRDLFAALLRDAAPLYGFVLNGYWCDIGDTEAYLRCCAQVLEKEANLILPAPQIAPGLWSASPVPAGAHVATPCYIGKNVVLGPESLVGPHSVIESDSQIGAQALVRAGVVQSAHIGAGASVSRAVVCRGAQIEKNASVKELSVVGEDCLVGAGAVIEDGVRLWPGKKIEPNSLVTAAVARQEQSRTALFEGGAVTGQVDADLTPEVCLRLGLAFAAVMTGEAGIGFEADRSAETCARSLQAGLHAAGRSTVECDASCACAAAFAARHLGFGGSVFAAREGGEISLYFSGANGRGLPPKEQKQMEALMGRGDFSRAAAGNFGKSQKMAGIDDAYAAAAAAGTLLMPERSKTGPVTIEVSGAGAAARIIRATMKRLGCRLPKDKKKGFPVLETDGQGLCLSACDETGEIIAPDRLRLIQALLDFELGAKKAAFPDDFPAAADTLAKRPSRAVLRPGRDGREAQVLLDKQRYFYDSVFGAAHLAAGLQKSGLSLSELNRAAPPFAVASAEVPLRTGRAGVMSRLTREDGCELRFGTARFSSGNGIVQVRPHALREALVVTSESASMEAAKEICGDFQRRITKLAGQEQTN